MFWYLRLFSSNSLSLLVPASGLEAVPKLSFFASTRFSCAFCVFYIYRGRLIWSRFRGVSSCCWVDTSLNPLFLGLERSPVTVPLKSENKSEAETDWLDGIADLLRPLLLPNLETWKLPLLRDCMRLGDVWVLFLRAENSAIFLGVWVGL